MPDPKDFDDVHADGEFTDGYFDESGYDADGASELLVAGHMHRSDRAKKAALAKKRANQQSANQGKSNLRKAWDAVRPAPLAHIKRNWKTILGATAGAGALATAGDFMLNDTTNFVNIAKTAAIGYPGFKALYGGLTSAGKWTGHFLNGWNEDKLRQYRTTPMGKTAGALAFGFAAVLGAEHGDKYFDAVENVTIHAPYTLTQGIPSALIDTFTDNSNTRFDPVWELRDQGSCLMFQTANPEHICLDGPGMEGVTVSEGVIEIDPAIITTDALENNEISWFERKGLNFELPDLLPEAEAVNDWIHEQLGTNTTPEL
ncbi:MAG: hypothetical protein ACLFR0_07795 [Alphaproteobacteria bacterium]